MDIDYWNHMNNARYARKFEWGRQHFLQRTGLGRTLTTMRVKKEEQRDEPATNAGVSSKRGVHFGFGSLAIRYRREVGTSLAFLIAHTFSYTHDRLAHDGLSGVYAAMPFLSSNQVKLLTSIRVVT